ncbi:unnamed protein product [Schistocephalus solidus]|uniref:Beta-lactamase domain-containing protein n=1 Tax=Schistocephalus solidus TaxID=70667 RepID=A0A183TFG4_SCHSO|nr:unnamed protein product [Schistocephalus solidus]
MWQDWNVRALAPPRDPGAYHRLAYINNNSASRQISFSETWGALSGLIAAERTGSATVSPPPRRRHRRLDVRDGKDAIKGGPSGHRHHPVWTTDPSTGFLRPDDEEHRHRTPRAHVYRR